MFELELYFYQKPTACLFYYRVFVLPFNEKQKEIISAYIKIDKDAFIVAAG